MEKNLPIDELKEYGIINDDNSFNSKLSATDIQKFLAGNILVADNDNQRLVFKLEDNKLNVQHIERNEKINNLLSNNDKFQYVEEYIVPDENNLKYGDSFKLKDNPNENFMVTEIVKNSSNKIERLSFVDSNGEELNMKIDDFKEKAFDLKSDTNIKVYIKENNQIEEFDLLLDIKEITEKIKEEKQEAQSNRYKVELQKLQSFLQDKIDKFPEIAKQITENMNIVSNEINSVNSISYSKKQEAKSDKTEIRYDINDPDLYQDANLEREEEAKEEQEIKRTGRRR